MGPNRSNLIPVARVEPEDVASTVVYLSVDDGRYVTGSAMAIDGGYMNLLLGIPPLAAQRLGDSATSPTRPAPDGA